MNPYQTTNVAAPSSAHRTSNAADRAFAVQEKVRELMKGNPTWSYDRAYSECAKLPEMKEVFDAMHQPAIQRFATGPTPAQKKASAQFVGKVQAAAHQRGITYDQAHEAMKAEEPELYAAMSGDQDPEEMPKDKVFQATLMPHRT